MGSRNLTERGYKKNFEAYAVVEVAKEGNHPASDALHSGIRAFCQICENYEMDDAATPADDIGKRLEKQRKELAATLDASQQLLEDGTVLLTSHSAIQLDTETELYVGRLGEVEAGWSAPYNPLKLAKRGAEENSDLLSFVLRANGEEVTWVQAVKFDPALDDERDAKLLRTYLGLKGLLDWLADTLSANGDAGGARTPWDVPRTHGVSSPGDFDTLSIESVLSSWVRRHESIREAKVIVEMATALLNDEHDEVLARRLASFLKSWRAIEETLL